MTDSKNNIELRSEKVRNIVGKIPPALLRRGISVITLIIFLLLAAAYFIPYPETLRFTVDIQSTPSCEIITAQENGFIEIQNQTTIVQKQQTIALLSRLDDDSTILIKSSYAGKLLINCPNRSYIKKGDILFSVIPENIENTYGLALISQKKMERIQIGQKVKVKLYDYSIHNKGLVAGEISKIYPIPENGNNYKIEIRFVNGLHAINTGEINYTPLLKGEATLFLSNDSFLKRFINSM